MKFQLESFHRDIPDAHLLADLVRVAVETGKTTLTFREYGKHGTFSASTISLRFGSWLIVLETAGSTLTQAKNISEEELFKNLLAVWMTIGKQPKTRDLSSSFSRFSSSTYMARYGGWRKALQKFVEWADQDDSTAEIKDSVTVDQASSARSTARNPSLRLRFKVLQRDQFRCTSCGASPAFKPGVVLHVDHHIPWSKGGDTVLNNLTTLCETCNLGKSNLMPGGT